jgi:Heterokaryon incompatibility protein (HET)
MLFATFSKLGGAAHSEVPLCKSTSPSLTLDTTCATSMADPTPQNPSHGEAITIPLRLTGPPGGSSSDSPEALSSSPPGIYQPLKDQDIRLIKFLPQDGLSNGDQRRCRLITTPLDQAPPYVALSYTWGTNVSERTITVNDIQLPITKNLAEAIDGLFEFVTKQKLYFWADFICIDQSNVIERGHQVQLMSLIYESAHQVAIWLGPHTHNSELLFSKMREWESEEQKLRDRNSKLPNSVANEAYLAYLQSMGPNSKALFEALDMMLCRQWWTRAWVVQEATAIHNSRTLLFCGDTVITWICLARNLYRWNVLHNDIGPAKLNLNFLTVINRISKWRSAGSQTDLLVILSYLRKFGCQDPRDKVYAALGMAIDIKRGDIVPDYSQSCVAVYQSVVKWCINSEKDHALDFLGYVARPSQVHSTGDDDMPSWVPDWRLGIRAYPFRKYWGDEKRYLGQPYNAGISRTSHIHINGSNLFVHGFVVDQVLDVQSLSHSRPLTSIEESLRKLRHRPAITSSGILGNIYVTGESMEEALSRTFVADIGYEDPDRGKVSRNFRVDWDLINIKYNNTVDPKNRLRKERMLRDISTAWWLRKLFVTRNGYIGLCPDDCLADDLICVFNGGSVLYALRECSDKENSTQGSTFKFMGECYVHGLMDGEACELETVQEREFILV